MHHPNGVLLSGLYLNLTVGYASSLFRQLNPAVVMRFNEGLTATADTKYILGNQVRLTVCVYVGVSILALSYGSVI